MGEAFDPDIEEVLEHWPVSHAACEVLAAALDEHDLTGTAEPVLERLGDGRSETRDAGRGRRYEHLVGLGRLLLRVRGGAQPPLRRRRGVGAAATGRLLSGAAG